jgi:hypothetical protein
VADGGQVAEAWGRSEILSLFDPATGLLDRRVHSDEGLYRLELERIFARGWNFMRHDSQIPETGDYFINHIGEHQVICVRGEVGEVNVLLHTRRHRGNASLLRPHAVGVRGRIRLRRPGGGRCDLTRHDRASSWGHKRPGAERG